MAYDPSILSKIGQMGPNPVGAMQDAYTLKNVIDTSQINQMKLNEEKQAVSDTNTLRSLAGKYDMSTGEGQAKFFAEASKVNPSMAMKLQREFSEAQSGQLGLKKAELELYAAKNDIIGNALLPIAQRGEELKAQGKSPQEINALMLPLVTQAVGTLKQQTLPNGKPVLEPQDLQQAQQLLGGGDLLSGVTGLVVKSKQSGERLHQLMQEQLAGRREAATERGLTERERHDREMERLAAKRAGDGATAAGGDKVGAVYAAMADQGVSFPSGMRSVAAQRQTIDGLIKSHPNDTPEQIVQRLVAGRVGLKAKETEVGVVARREGASAAAIEALNEQGGLYDQLLETGKGVDFGSNVFKNQLELWKAGKAVADPKIRDYLNALADTRAEFASVLARGGQVTDSVRIATEHAFPDTMSLQELQTAVSRSKKIAGAIQAGNDKVIDRLVNGESLATVSKKAEKPTSPAPSTAVVPPGGPPSGAGGAGPSDLDQQALAWANANPNDPKAALIKQRLGVR